MLIKMSLLSRLFIFCASIAQLNGFDPDQGDNVGGPKDSGLIQEIKPNFDPIKGLVCYQCKSDTSDKQPLCDKSMFKLATQEEKYNMSLQCPHYQGAYCFTKVTRKGRITETIRGCSGSKDKNGNLMKAGCMTTEKVHLCLCDKKFCNRASKNVSRISVLILVIIVLVSVSTFY